MDCSVASNLQKVNALISPDSKHWASRDGCPTFFATRDLDISAICLLLRICKKTRRTTYGDPQIARTQILWRHAAPCPCLSCQLMRPGRNYGCCRHDIQVESNVTSTCCLFGPILLRLIRGGCVDGEGQCWRLAVYRWLIGPGRTLLCWPSVGKRSGDGLPWHGSRRIQRPHVTFGKSNEGSISVAVPD